MSPSPRIRCAIYTRKSSEEGLEQSFNSLHAQREACEAYILSQRHEGWQVVREAYDDGGFSGGSMERPALKKLLEDIARKLIDTVVVYKVDRLTRSLTDFAKIVEQFDKQGVSFVSVTQQFNTTTSMGRLTLNVLLSFAQFEREVTGERIRDKVAASKRKGMWMGGVVPVGYEVKDRQLVINPTEAERVREIYRMYLKLGCVSKVQEHLDQTGVRSKERTSRTGRSSGGAVYSRGALYGMLQNHMYLGKVHHQGTYYPGQQPAIIDQELWDKVQARFAANLQAPRRRPRSASKSLLTGLLYDPQGSRFTPSHAAKGARRYRYYVSQAVIKKPGRAAEGPTRLPADELEELVISQVQSFLQSPQRMQDVLCSLTAGSVEIQRAAECAQKWAAATVAQVRAVVPTIVKRVIVHDNLIELQLSRCAIREAVTGLREAPSLANESPISEDLIILEAQATVSKCRGEVRLVLAPDAAQGSPRSIPSLIKAVVRAHDWVDRIARGEVPHQRAIAAETGLHRRYVGRIMQIAFLAPDITEAILEGRQPPHMTLDTLMADMPTDWAGQRKQLLPSYRPTA
jgi:DNA invertase Pin-like site-specific DNA recombinase